VSGSSLLARTPQNQQQCLSAFGTGLVSRLHYHNPLFYSPLTLSVASPSTFKITCESTLPPACVTIARSTPGAVLKDNQRIAALFVTLGYLASSNRLTIAT